VVAWAAHSAWLVFRRFPKVIRWLVYIWIFGVMVSQCQSSGKHNVAISDSDAQKLKEIAKSYRGSAEKTDITKLATQIASEFAEDDKPSGHDPVLAIPFSTPSEDPAARRLADATFAQLCGRVAISHHGRVGLLEEPLDSPDPALATQRGREHHSKYVLYGTVDESVMPHRLSVKMLSVDKGTVRWSGSYPIDGADPAAIATEVDSRMHELEDED
jgi:TolB-like protein